MKSLQKSEPQSLAINFPLFIETGVYKLCVDDDDAFIESPSGLKLYLAEQPYNNVNNFIKELNKIHKKSKGHVKKEIKKPGYAI